MSQAKPGDVIEWVYVTTCHVVDAHERLWSTVEKRYVPIGSGVVHFLVSHDEETLTLSWLNSDGLFTASYTDTTRPPMIMPRKFVFVRPVQTCSLPR